MVIDGIIDDDLISQILLEYKTSDAWTHYDKGAKGGAMSILLSHPAVIGNSERRKTISDNLLKALATAFDKYHEKHSYRERGLNFLPIKQLVGLRLLKYKKGQSLDLHTDKYTDPDSRMEVWPAVTFSLSLNSNYAGGELCVLNKKHCFRGQTGQVVFFPSNFLFPHYVETVQRGIRYAIVGWFL